MNVARIPDGRWVAGVDLSTERIDVAAVPLEPAAPAWLIAITAASIAPIRPLDKARRAQAAADALDVALRELTTVLGVRAGHAYRVHLDAIAFEDPVGPHRNADRALLPLLGALTAAARPLPAAWFQAQEWRRILHAGRTKSDGHVRVRELAAGHADGLDSHALDALGIALAFRAYITGHHPAA